jgi:hypothetical protein
MQDSIRFLSNKTNKSEKRDSKESRERNKRADNMCVRLKELIFVISAKGLLSWIGKGKRVLIIRASTDTIKHL